MSTPRFDDRAAKGIAADTKVEQPQPLGGGRLYTLWQSLSERERFAFIGEALSEGAAGRLLRFLAAQHEEHRYGAE